MAYTENKLVPEHEKLSDDEKEELLEEYEIRTKELPKILMDDPAIEDMDTEAGDVIKITRDSPTQGESTYYRVVVEG